MKKSIFSNFGLKIMSVLVAFLIWLMVVNGDDPVGVKAYKDVPITIANADVFEEKVKKVYKPRNDVDTVTVYVKARRSVTSKLDKNSFTVTADFENIINDLNSIPLTITCNSGLVNLEDVWCDSPSFKVDLENVKDASFVVNVKQEGTPGTGYEVGTTKLVQGDSIAIAGPESDMRKIDKVYATLKVAGMTTNQTLKAPLTIIDKNGEEFTESQMKRLTIKTTDGEVFEKNEMDVSVVMWKVKTGIVPEIKIGGIPADGYRVAKVTTTPETLSLVGSDEMLKKLEGKLVIDSSISADGASENFTADLNLKEYLESEYKQALRQEADASETIVVSVQLEQIGTTPVNIPVSDIVVKGKPDDMNMTLTPADMISLEIQKNTGSEPDITADDIQVTLDLTQYQAVGNYKKVPLSITLPEGYTLASEATITVNLVKNEKTTEIQSELIGGIS